MSDAIITLATVPAILATVNLAKQFGVKGRWAALAAVALGILFQELDYITLYMADWGQIDPRQLLMQAGEGFLLGLGAAGLYDLTPGTTKPQHDPAGVLAPLVDEADPLATLRALNQRMTRELEHHGKHEA